MVKKLIALALCVVSFFSIAACAVEDETPSSSKPVSSVSSKKESSKASSKKEEPKYGSWDSKKLEKIPEVVSGIKDMTAEKTKSKDEKLDIMSLVKYDDKIVKSVTVDDSKVDYSKAGTYEVTYTITFNKAELQEYLDKNKIEDIIVPKTETQTITVTVTVKVDVLEPKEIEKLKEKESKLESGKKTEVLSSETTGTQAESKNESKYVTQPESKTETSENEEKPVTILPVETNKPNTPVINPTAKPSVPDTKPVTPNKPAETTKPVTPTKPVETAKPVTPAKPDPTPVPVKPTPTPEPTPEPVHQHSWVEVSHERLVSDGHPITEWQKQYETHRISNVDGSDLTEAFINYDGGNSWDAFVNSNDSKKEIRSNWREESVVVWEGEVEIGLLIAGTLAYGISRRLKMKKAMQQKQKPVVKNDNIIDVKAYEPKCRKRR